MEHENEVPVTSSGSIGEGESCGMYNSVMEVDESTASEISIQNKVGLCTYKIPV